MVEIVREEPDSLLRLKLRQPDAAILARLAGVVGAVLPGPNTVAEAGAVRIAWIGPEDWLLTGAGDRLAMIGAAIAGTTGLVREVGDGHVRFRLSGPSATDVLAQGTSLDLRATALPVGGCAVTLFAQLDVVIERRAETQFTITADASTAHYLERWFAQATAGT